jgi:DNA helicase-2/ATP-dependent DNA helicase PcrA
LFNEYPKISSLYRRSFYAICIDEAQDLNNAQYHFLKALAGNEFTNILMVGDPNQSIFHFNGSSPDFMNKHFVSDFSAETVELSENFRSSIEVLNAAKKIVPDAEHIKETVKRGIFEIHKKRNETEEAQWIIEKIQELIKLETHNDIEGEINYEKIAILARNKYLFKPLENALNQSKIDFYYKIAPGALKFESPLMQIFDLAFRVRLNSQDILHKKRLLKELELEGNTNLSLEEINVSTLIDDEKRKIISLVISLEDSGKNFKKSLQNYQENVVLDDDNDKSMLFNDINELLSHWHNYAKNTENTTLHQFKNSMSLGQTHPLTQHSGVTLSTIHTMKGQEFDIVFIIGMDDETFPDYRAIRNNGVEMLQEKNNLYVAFTRSKRWLYVTWPENRTMPWGDIKSRKVSRFLDGFTPENNL